MYYFGCIRQPGHYLWTNNGEKFYGTLPDGFPESWAFTRYGDTRYVREAAIAPNAYGEQGLAEIAHEEGWTRISFPDRSIDERPNCVSVFMEKGKKTFEEMMEIAHREFPQVTDRYNFLVIPKTQKGNT